MSLWSTASESTLSWREGQGKQERQRKGAHRSFLEQGDEWDRGCVRHGRMKVRFFEGDRTRATVRGVISGCREGETRLSWQWCTTETDGESDDDRVRLPRCVKAGGGNPSSDTTTLFKVHACSCSRTRRRVERTGRGERRHAPNGRRTSERTKRGFGGTVSLRSGIKFEY